MKVGDRVTTSTKFGGGVFLGVEGFKDRGMKSFTETDPVKVQEGLEAGKRMLVRVDEIPAEVRGMFPNNVLACYTSDNVEVVPCETI